MPRALRRLATGPPSTGSRGPGPPHSGPRPRRHRPGPSSPGAAGQVTAWEMAAARPTTARPRVVALLDVGQRPGPRNRLGPGLAIAALARAAPATCTHDQSAVDAAADGKRSDAAIRRRVTLINAPADRLPPPQRASTSSWPSTGSGSGRAERLAELRRGSHPAAPPHRVPAPLPRRLGGHVQPRRRRHREPARTPARRPEHPDPPLSPPVV